MSMWEKHVEKWETCQRCPLGCQRDRICLARGTVPCDVLMVGEAPGASEDAWGLPFYGPAGDLLDHIVKTALSPIVVCATCGMLRYKNLTTDDWTCANSHTRAAGHGGRDVRCAYTNLVACFPRNAKQSGDNQPEYNEIMACQERLVEFVNVAQPRMIVTVGNLSEEYTPNRLTMTYCKLTHPARMLRMKRAQMQEAVYRAGVILKSAVVNMLESEYKPFVEWSNAEKPKATDYGIPF